jgi:outer membrane immunogenic protein
MKKAFIAGLAFAALIVPAMAADLAPYAKAPPVALSWTGLYIGANIGWTGSDNSLTNTGTDTGAGGLGTALAIGAISGVENVDHSGFMGGGQIGYNWQVGRTWVLGVEADFDGVRAKSSLAEVFTGSVAPPFLPITTVYNRELDSLGTVRGRLGYLMTPEVLWYVTGGLAYAQTKLGTAALCPTFAPPCSTESSTAVSSSNTSVGWTAGTGVEWRFAPAWSVKVEYLYADLGHRTNTISYTYPGNTSSLTSAVNEHDNIGRIGINYKLF